MTELNEREQNSNQEDAGFWIRVLAFCIDFTILFIFKLIFGSLIITYFKTTGGIMPPLITITCSAGYYIWLHGKYGQTLGKMIFNIKVIQTTNEPITYKDAVVRYMGTFANFFTLGIGYLMVGFRSDKRGLHDFIASTKVIYTRKPNKLLIGIMVFLFLAIPGIFTAIVVPPLMDSISNSKAGSIKGTLAGLRGSVEIYYKDKGEFPTGDLSSTLITNRRYRDAIPKLDLPDHKKTNEIITITESHGKDLTAFIEDTGKWLYMADPKSKDWGKLIIDCTHKDVRSEKYWFEH